MDASDLRKMLGMKPPAPEKSKKDTPKPVSIVVREQKKVHRKKGGATREEEIMYSRTVFELDLWDLEMGESCLAKREDKHQLSAEEMADFMFAAWSPDPKFAEYTLRPRLNQFFHLLMETSDYRSLHGKTLYNRAASELAASKFADQWLSLKEKDRERSSPADEKDFLDDKKREKSDEDKKGSPRKSDKPKPGDEATRDEKDEKRKEHTGTSEEETEEDSEEREDAEEGDTGTSGEEETFAGESEEAEVGAEGDGDLLKAVSTALACASEEVTALTEAIGGLTGMGPGTRNSIPLDPDKQLKLFEKIRNDPVVRRICEMLGKYTVVADSKQRHKLGHGWDEMMGVELSGDIGRILPHELALMSIPEFEMDTMRRLVENQCMSRDFKAMEKVGKGPAIIVVDESGSMSGPKVENAKALALAMAYICKHQRRWCCLIGFSGATGHNILTLSPESWDELKLFEWLKHFFGGGSNLDLPIREMPDFWQEISPPRGKTDLVFITDAACNFSEREADTFMAWKVEESVRLVSLVIGNYGVGQLGEISDEIHLINTLSPDEDGVASCLSI